VDLVECDGLSLERSNIFREKSFKILRNLNPGILLKDLKRFAYLLAD